jgi:hypothetical protein
MKGEAAALSVRAQRCQSRYFSTTPRTINETKFFYHFPRLKWLRKIICEWRDKKFFRHIRGYEAAVLATDISVIGPPGNSLPICAIGFKTLYSHQQGTEKKFWLCVLGLCLQYYIPRFKIR